MTDIKPAPDLMKMTTDDFACLYEKLHLMPKAGHIKIRRGATCAAGVVIANMTSKTNDTVDDADLNEALRDLENANPSLTAFEAGFDAGMLDSPSHSGGTLAHGYGFRHGFSVGIAIRQKFYPTPWEKLKTRLARFFNPSAKA